MIKFKQFLIENKKDIIVTIPRSQYKNDDIETKDMLENNKTQFWAMKKLPKHIDIGSRIYFVKNGVIESSMKIFKIEKNKIEKCSTTGNIWEGNILHLNDLLYLNSPIPMKGFMGYRYYEPDKDLS